MVQPRDYLMDYRFSLWHDLAPSPPLPPLSGQWALWATHRKTEKERQLADGTGGDGRRKEFTRRWESLVLYNPLNILWRNHSHTFLYYFIFKRNITRFESIGWWLGVSQSGPSRKGTYSTFVNFIIQVKGTVPRDFVFKFFSWTTFHKPLSISSGLFQIFSKIRGDIRSSRCTIGVIDTGGKWKKSSIGKVLIIFFLRLWVVELTYRQMFSFKFTLRRQQRNIVPIICHWYCWHWWQIHQWYQKHQQYQWQNSPPVSLIPM